MTDALFTVRDILPEEFDTLGQILVEVYTQMDGFPNPEDQPAYYEMLKNIGRFTEQPDTRVLVAISMEGEILGGVVYFSDMSRYGSGGTATSVKNASGMRLLGVNHTARGNGVGRELTRVCIELAREKQQAQMVLHTTRAMQTAWQMYERMGFRRSEDLDFLQEDLEVFGFRLQL